MDATIHIAGLDVQVGSRLRQRCGWCGAILVDQDLANVAVLAEDAGRPFPTWPVGELIERTDGGGLTRVIDHEDGAQLPPEACAHVDHEVTA